ATAFVILSYYSVVAGWALHYTWLAASNAFLEKTPEQIAAIFSNSADNPGVYENARLNLAWHIAFMTLTVGIVIGGIQKGLERWVRILMPLLFLMMIVLVFRAMTMDGFQRALQFVFAPNADNLTAAGVLEALGHAFFTLSLGMGAMITYGSYLREDDDLVTTSITVAALDTAIALMSCLVIFPIIFTFGMDPSGGPGLVFVNLPIALSQLPGGAVWGVVFFVLLTFAALTSGISLLEVAVSYFIDEKGWNRTLATLACGGAILLLGIPSALSGSGGFFGGGIAELTSHLGVNEGNGFNWFDFFDYLASNWMLPLGGLGLAVFVAWRVGGQAREEGFKAGTKFGALYWGWVQLLRYLVPLGVIAVLLYATGILRALGVLEH
ncbi:MAG: sodium-dependent transporter, partial [Gemmatimonadetes bacterium]|nr:sodium-dependent transporter [Gemmatimonadota bacterium]